MYLSNYSKYLAYCIVMLKLISTSATINPWTVSNAIIFIQQRVTLCWINMIYIPKYMQK